MKATRLLVLFTVSAFVLGAMAGCGGESEPEKAPPKPKTEETAKPKTDETAKPKTDATSKPKPTIADAVRAARAAGAETGRRRAEWAKAMKCQHHLERIWQASMMYMNRNRRLPKAYDADTGKYWHDVLVDEAYLESDETVRCPASDRPVGYGYNGQLDLDLRIQPAKIIVLVESHKPVVTAADLAKNIAPRHAGKVNVLFADGHVEQLLPKDIKPGMLAAEKAAGTVEDRTRRIVSGKDEYESAIKYQVGCLEEMNSILASVKDTASAKRAKPKLEAISKKMAAVSERMARTEFPSEEKWKELAKKYGLRARKARNEIMKNMARLRADPDLKDALDGMGM